MPISLVKNEVGELDIIIAVIYLSFFLSCEKKINANILHFSMWRLNTYGRPEFLPGWKVVCILQGVLITLYFMKCLLKLCFYKTHISPLNWV